MFMLYVNVSMWNIGVRVGNIIFYEIFFEGKVWLSRFVYCDF